MVTSIRPAVTAPDARWLGLLGWVLALLLPIPFQERILLAAPLVLVPLLLGRLPGRPISQALDTRSLGMLAVPVALLLPASLALPRGPVAALFAVPWLVLAALAAAAGVRDLVAGGLALLRPARAGDLASDAALVGLAVGASWLLIDRSGIDVPGIPALIGTLTAVHFHFAAFGLVGIAALTATSRPRRVTWLAIVGLIVGIWVTAAGFVVPSLAIGWIGAVSVGTSGLLLATLLARGPGGPVVSVASGALAVGMVLAIAWPTGLALWPGLLDIDLMVRTHGVLNASAVMLLAWTTDRWVGAHR